MNQFRFPTSVSFLVLLISAIITFEVTLRSYLIFRIVDLTNLAEQSITIIFPLLNIISGLIGLGFLLFLFKFSKNQFSYNP